MNKLMTITLALTAAASLSGCGNTLSGAKQDTANDTAKTQQAADQAAQSTKTAADQAAQSTKTAADQAAQSTKAAADQAGQAVKTDADKAGQAVATLPQDAAASAITIPVKTAIIRDPVVADARNLVNVSGKGSVITLNGHVATAGMKTRAEQDAKVALRDHPGYKLVNALTVSGQ